jgi:hypothetical protein
MSKRTISEISFADAMLERRVDTSKNLQLALDSSPGAFLLSNLSS